MTSIGGVLPRVSTYADPSESGLATALDAALTMLGEAQRLVRVGPGEPADIVHTVGGVDLPGRQAGRHVHTVDRIPLRDGRLAPAGWWVRSERRRLRGTTAWLAHGQTAGRVLVDAGLAPGERVHCLPLISPVACATVEASRAARAVVRARLGLAPGVRLVMGVEPDSPAHATDRWDRALLGTRRRDVVVARIRPAGARADCFQVRLVSGLWLNEPVRLPELLAAADVFIAAGHDLEAYTPAVAAVACGIPVVAVTTDSVAELVMSGGRGCVVPARAAQITAAVVAQLDGGLPARRTPATATDQSHRLAEFARALLAVYRHVLCTSVVGAA